MAEVIANSPTPGVSAQLTTLGAAITTTGQTSITASAAVTGNLLNGNFRILIGDGVQNSGAYETALVTAGQSGTAWTITRAVESSTAYTWNNGTPIYHVWTAAAMANAVGTAMISQWWYSVAGSQNQTAHTASTTAGTLTAYPIIVRAPLLADALGYRNGSTQAGATLLAGLYADSGNGYPGALIAGTSVSFALSSTTGNIVSTFTTPGDGHPARCVGRLLGDRGDRDPEHHSGGHQFHRRYAGV